MSLLVRRVVTITATLLIYTLISFSSLSFLAWAQEPAPFEISLIPQAEDAITDQPLTYTVIVTNVSPTAVQNVVVTVKVPTGTVLVDVPQTNPDWYSNKPYPGVIREEAQWFTPKPVAPGEVITLAMVVKPLPESNDSQIVNEEYSVAVASEEGVETVATGSPITLPVLTPTPMPSVTALATDTPPAIVMTPSPTLTPPGVTPTIIASTSTAIAEVNPDRVATKTPAPTIEPLQETLNTSSSRSSSSVILFITIGLIGLAVASLTWFLRKK